MRAVALDYGTHALSERNVAEPAELGPREVLFRVHQVGVCGTDRDLARFRFGYPPGGEAHLILGHEALGQVIETGRDAAGVRKGDWVVPMIRRPCAPPCAACARGRQDLCATSGYTERGIFGAHGYFCDFAVDEARYLVVIPENLLDVAVLVEPASVVEKAVASALRAHPGEPRSALVIGAGPIGVLAALVLQLRGMTVAARSLEPPGHPRAKLLETAGVRYFRADGGERLTADIVIEAAGTAEAGLATLEALAPSGVAVFLGAMDLPAAFPLRDLIVGNRTVLGSVNAAPESFSVAVADLGSIDRELLKAMIRRAGFADFAASILGPPAGAVKTVHVIAG